MVYGLEHLNINPLNRTGRTEELILMMKRLPMDQIVQDMFETSELKGFQ